MKRKAAAVCDQGYHGTMTVFMGMTLLMILSVFFSLLEVNHYQALKKEAREVSGIGMESMFADYCRVLWDQYGILGIDGGYGSSKLDPDMASARMTDYLLDNLSVPSYSRSSHHLQMAVSECNISGYGLLCDGHGRMLLKECAKSALYGLPDGVLEGLQEQVGTVGESKLDWQDMLDNGQDAYESAWENYDDDYDDEDEDEEDDSEKWHYERPPGGLSEQEAYSVGNPIEEVMEWKARGVLKQVLPDQAVSTKTFTINTLPSHRSLSSGTLPADGTLSPLERLLCQYYFLEKFSSFVHPMHRKGMYYEVEYLIGGENSDKENLAQTVEELLVFRGAMNLGSLVSDPKKMAEAESVALALAGATLNPAIVEAVQAGIVAAWVYVESILDIRTLLDGGKVAIVKTPADWTSSILSLPACLNVEMKARESRQGVSYESALTAMLVLVSDKKLGLRAMDVLENELHGYEDYQAVKADNLIYRVKADYQYRGMPVFGSLVTIGTPPDGYEFLAEEEMSYVSDTREHR